MSDGLSESMKDFKNYSMDTTGGDTIQYHKVVGTPKPTMTFAEAIGYIKGLLAFYDTIPLTPKGTADLLNKIKEAVDLAFEIPSVNTPLYTPPVQPGPKPPFEITCKTKNKQ